MITHLTLGLENAERPEPGNDITQQLSDGTAACVMENVPALKIVFSVEQAQYAVFSIV